MQDDAADARWFDLTALPQPLAFDHKLVLRAAFSHLLKHPDTATSGTPHSRTCVCMLAKLLQVLSLTACCVCLADALRSNLKQGMQLLEGPWEPPKE